LDGILDSDLVRVAQAALLEDPEFNRRIELTKAQSDRKTSGT
jgi:hypothetical protein